MFLKKYFSLLSWSVIIILQACNTTHNYDELKKIVLDVKSGNIIPFSKNVIAEFVNENTWKKRIDKIEEVLSHN